ncbi:MAG TPA: endonuclease/exonuclease/phosphatase family protein, partial [Candidatus Limnocylindria bacterium]|nr:endonuclease/exonuclease/phosphatase family protein [Candidatus Limnocylindria bacterium]
GLRQVGVAALRVVSWNIRAAIGTGPFPDRWWSRIDADRLRAIGAFLSPLEADVVALQEVALVSRDGDLVDNAGYLARQLGMEVRYGAVRTFSVTDGDAVTGAGCFGNALMSRLPLDDVRTVSLPRAPMDAFVEPPGASHPAAGVTYADAPESVREPRCLLLATVAGLRIGTAHFSHIGSGERLLQAEATVAAFGDASPSLLLGDLNAVIESSELAPFASWTDAFAEPPGDPARVTTDDGYRIDQVLVRGASASPVRVLRESGDLSDHYPVVATVDW